MLVGSNNNNPFYYKGWQKYTLTAIAVVQIITIIMFVLTELGNIASNMWLTNVFGGCWCGFILLIQVVALLINVWWLRGPKASFYVVIITIVTLLTCALLISFKGVFLAQPSTCLLTPQCTNNSLSTTLFTYNMSQNFFAVFNNLNGFRNYTLSQSKYLFQTIQISFGCLSFVMCLVHIAIYVMARADNSKRVTPFNNRGDDSTVLHAVVDKPANRRPKPSARVPQAAPGERPWIGSADQ